MIKYIVLFTALIFATLSCKNSKNHDHDDKNESKHNHDHGHGHHHGDANEHMNHSNFEDLIQRFESPERDSYQKPYEVIGRMGNLKDKVVIEIGSGTGYFSFKLVEKGAKVIAADVDDRFQAYIKHKRDSLQISSDQLKLRKVPFDSPELASGEVDMALIVNTYHHIENRVEYFKKVKSGIKDGGALVVVDFFKKDLPMGPPTEMKLTSSEVKEELEQAGFSNFEIDEKLLEYQYVIIAN